MKHMEPNDSRRYTEMREHLRQLCDELEETHGIEVRDAAAIDSWEICFRCVAEGSIAAAHAKARKVAKLVEELGLRREPKP